MKIKCAIVTVMLIIATIFITGSSINSNIKTETKDNIISWCRGNIDNTGDKLFVVAGNGYDELKNINYGDRLLVYDVQGELPKIEKVTDTAKLGEPLYVFDLADLKPLKVQIGDVNGDGVKEIALCVYKTTYFHPVMAKRPFFYDLVNGELKPVWLGSRLSHPFLDYILVDIDDDGEDELISIDVLENNHYSLYAYKWKGFGFTVYARSDKFKRIGSLQKAEDNKIKVEIFFNDKETEVTFKYTGNERLEITED